MEYFAIHVPSAETSDAADLVFDDKSSALKTFKTYKDARFKSFKSRDEALSFVKKGTNPTTTSIFDSVIKSPPPNQPPIKSLEKSNFPSLKPQDLVSFRKEIEANNHKKVYELICTNPRYLVGSGDTPSILKESARYNALHVAAINKHAKVTKVILQMVEQPQFIELLYAYTEDSLLVAEMNRNLLESYLNTPDKARNETPLHFASKFGAVEVIEVLLSYPQCKMMPNKAGEFPKDIICDRAQDTPPHVKKAIEDLLKERYFVPVLRSIDSSVQPTIGEPFTPANMPKYNEDPLRPSVEIKAYAGPMTSEQAQSFQKRWKTPPRLMPSCVPGGYNSSLSPKHSLTSTPARVTPRMSKSLTDTTPTLKNTKKKLMFHGSGDSEEDTLDNMNVGDSNGNVNYAASGNVNYAANGILGEHEEEEYKELFDDLLEAKNQMEQEMYENGSMFQGYRNPEPILQTPIRAKPKNDTNSNHIMNRSLLSSSRLNSSDAMMTYHDESGSVYNSDSVFNSPSFKEKNIRLTDTSKGLEQIGRDLAKQNNFSWKEHWGFLGRFLDIRSDEGLACFESYLKQKELERNSLVPLSPAEKLTDSFGLGAVCAGLENMGLNDEISVRPSKLTKNGLASPSISLSRQSLLNEFSSASQRNTLLNNAPVNNPYTCIEVNCRSFSKSLMSSLKSEAIQDQHSYEKTLLQEINKLNTSIDNYKRDPRFNNVNFQKIHARYSILLVWYLKKNNVKVKYLRNSQPLITKVYALASQFEAPNSMDSHRDISKSHAICLSSFITKYIEKEDEIYNPENVNTETACVDAWNGPFIVECSCSFGANITHWKNRREIRKKLYDGKKLDLLAARMNEMSDDEDSFLSCSDSEDSEYFTPPSSPTPFDQPFDLDDVFEESLESIEDEKDFSLFIDGAEPTKTDRELFNALGEDAVIDSIKYHLVYKWFNVMKIISIKPCESSLKINFKFSTPKLKGHASEAFSS